MMMQDLMNLLSCLERYDGIGISAPQIGRLGVSDPYSFSFFKSGSAAPFNLSFDGEGGLILSSFFKEFFSQPKLDIFRGVYCLGVWSRGHKVRGHPCKFGNLAIFYHAK